MKQFRDQNQRAHIIRDKLFVNGRSYAPQDHRLPPRPVGNSHGDYTNGAHGQDQRQVHFTYDSRDSDVKQEQLKFIESFLNICCLNVCGVISKLKNPDF